MHDPIETMIHEHEVISQTEEIVGKLEGLMNQDQHKYRSVVRQLLDFYRTYADQYHHRKEEQVLFPAIVKHPDFVLDEMVEELESHHEDFRTSLGDIEASLNNENLLESYDLLGEYLSELLDHIGAENDELFVLAENLLEEEDLETIYFHFKDIDLELGEEQKEELEKSVEELLSSF